MRARERCERVVRTALTYIDICKKKDSELPSDNIKTAMLNPGVWMVIRDQGHDPS